MLIVTAWTIIVLPQPDDRETALKSIIYQDATLDLDLGAVAGVVDSLAPSFGLKVGSARFELPTRIVSVAEWGDELPPKLVTESEDADVVLMLTAKPYDNNYFWQFVGNRAVVSFYEWHLLTNLPIENGLVYFLTSMLLDRLGVDLNHQTNIGCISDFFWDKRGVDVGLRASFLCSECAERLETVRDRGEARLVLKDAGTLLDHICQASRAESSILNRHDDVAFDCFLAYNWADKSSVRALNLSLQAARIRTWFDEEQIRPGFPWQDALEKQISAVRSALICVGPSGIGPWQNREMRGFIHEFVERSCPIIPVILPEVLEPPELPLFLRQFAYVDFRMSTPDPIEHIRFGITGVRNSSGLRGPRS